MKRTACFSSFLVFFVALFVALSFYSVAYAASSITPDKSFKSGTDYYISPVANSSLVLDASGAKPQQGSNVSVWSRNNGANQKWRLELGSDGYYTIKNAANQVLYLDAAGQTPRMGSNVTTWKDTKGLNQKWIIEKDKGSYIIHNARNTDFVLDASGVSPKMGANVSVWQNNGGNNQHWTIRTQADINAELDSLAAKNASAVSDGSYTIYAASISGNPVIDVKGASKDNGANIQTAASNSSASQTWEISHSSNYVLIKNKQSNKFLSVAGSNSVSGANVVLGPDSRAAKWIFIKNSDGTFSIRSALFTDISLDIAGGSSKAGANIETWTSHTGAAQKFTLLATPGTITAGDTSLDTNSYYQIKSFSDNGLQLDITGASTADNANVELWTSQQQPWQMFKFQNDGGFYRIIAVNSGKALTVANNSALPGANVVTFQPSSTSASQLWRAEKVSADVYRFVNKQNGLALQVSSSTQKAGTNVNVGKNNSADNNQKFKLQKVSSIMPTGLLNFKSALNANLMLDVTGASTAENTNIEIWSNNSGLAQKWSVQLVSGTNDTYTLQAVCSGKYLIDNGSGNAVQNSNGTSNNAKWKASIVGNSYVLTNVATGKALDVSGAKAASGANVCTWQYSGANNQRWNPVGTVPLPNGTYLIRSAVNTNQVIDVSGNSTANNANVTMYDYTGGNNQKFDITRNSDGTYTIVNFNSGKALDATGGASSAGTNIAQFTKNGGANQKWRVEYTNDGAFRFVSAANANVVIGFNASAPSRGLNVCLVAKDNNSKAQHFVLQPTTGIPRFTGNTSLDTRLYNLAKSQGSLRNCYNWVKNHTHTNWAGSGIKRYENGSTYWYADEVSRMLDGRPTDCYAFAATFAGLANALGYDAKAVCGYVPSRSMGWAAHSWVEIRKNGTTYVYDPDLGRGYPGTNFYEFTYGKAPTNYKF